MAVHDDGASFEGGSPVALFQTFTAAAGFLWTFSLRREWRRAEIP